MDVATNGAAAPDAGTLAPVTTDTDSGPISIRAAAAALTKRREDQNSPSRERAPDGKFARAETQESTPETGNDAAPDEVRSEAEVIDPADDLPSIDPPRSWSKEDKELFANLPRETQERLAERERSRESDFLKRQNDAAEKAKTLDAERQRAEQARLQYEQAVTESLQVLQSQMASEFADVKSSADALKLAEEDPFRYARYQAQMQAVHELRSKAQEAEQKRGEESRKQFDTWATEQDRIFTESAKEFADPEKATKARDGVISYLTEVRGIPREALPGLWSNPLFRDAKMQMIVLEASKWHAAQKKATEAAQRPVPPVQRPGAAPTKGQAQASTIQSLEQKLSSAKTTREQIAAAAALRAAKRAAQ